MKLQAYLDTGEESLADLDPNSVSSHFLRSAVPKSAVMDGRASTFGGFPSAEDTEDEQLRLYTCNSTGFLCDTSSFLRVSALSPTRERRGTPSKTPPQTAPSSLQTAGDLTLSLSSALSVVSLMSTVFYQPFLSLIIGAATPCRCLVWLSHAYSRTAA